MASMFEFIINMTSSMLIMLLIITFSYVYIRIFPLLKVKEGIEAAITNSFSSDTLNSIATEDDSSSSQKDDSSIRDSDSGVPPMPLRRIKELSEYDDLNENTEITTTKSKDAVAGAESSAELVGYKANPESKLQMIENEDAIRNDLPSLQKRGEVLAPKNRDVEAVSDERVEEEGAEDEKRNVEGLNMDEKDKYSSRLDDALAKLDELEEESAEAKALEEKQKQLKNELKLDSKSKYKINDGEKNPGKSDVIKEGEIGKQKAVFDLKGELDELKSSEKIEKGENDDAKSISDSDTSSAVASPKRVRIFCENY